VNQVAKTVEIVIHRDIIKRFNIMLQEGVYIDIERSMPLKEFLLDRCGITEVILSGKIKTIFLNSKPVDDVSTVHVGPGDHVSLSGAMPGLAGAVFRQKSLLSSFRETITHKSDTGGISNIDTPGMVLLKVFNTVMDAVAQPVFHSGVFVPVSTCTWIFEVAGDLLKAENVSLKFDGKKIKMKKFLNELMSLDNQLLYLVIYGNNG